MSVVFASDLVPVREVPAPDFHKPYPLVLDFDGTLLRTDLLLEAALDYVKRRPIGIFMLLLWALRGVAHLKHQLASRTELAVSLLPINDELVTYARLAAEGGREVIAATAANRVIAEKVRARFGFVSEVLASCDRVNLKGPLKAEALTQRFPDGYAYAGDAGSDLAVWRHARFGVFAGRDPALLDRLCRVTALEAAFIPPRAQLKDWLRAMRLHQWAKNGLLFIPLLLAGQLLDPSKVFACIAAFVAMGLVASATYILNDLLDLEADRQHWSKRKRPFAAGVIGIPQAIAASTLLLTLGFGLAAVAAGPAVLGLLGLYCAVTLGYSLHLKRTPILDVTVLAALFTLRLVLGAAAVEVRISAWLLVFSMFLFLSLALAKRSTEIERKFAADALENGNKARGYVATDVAGSGRGYIAADAPIIAGFGVSSALAAVQVMVLYLINDAFSDTLYGFPQLLWVAPVVIGLWLGRVWLLCGRGILNDDPVVFAVSDKVSLALGGCVLASFIGAAVIA